MEKEWSTWCRLCGKIEASKDSVINLTIDLMEMMKTCFSIQLFADEDFPVIVCADCQKFAIKLEDFGRQCVKVDKMFTHLTMVWKDEAVSKNINNIRFGYGIDYHNYEYNDTTANDIDSNSLTEPSNEVENHCDDSKKSITPPKKTMLKMSRKRRKGLSKSKHDKKCNLQSEEYTELEKYIKKEKIESSVKPLIVGENSDLKEVANNEDTSLTSWECPVCSKTFDTAQSRNTHLKNYHPDIGRPFKCSVCPKTFPTARNLKLHGNTHLPDSEKMVHRCPYCNKCFSKSVNARAHIQYMHISYRSFICEECGKAFITKGSLKEHCLTHTDERPFQCATCSKSFKNFQQMKIHEVTHSGNPVECKICNKKLNTKKTLREHMIVHSEVKNHKCHICGNEYKRRKTLTRHLATHTGKPTKC